MIRILRVLITSRCNLQCVYCHNEGQSSAPVDIDPRLLMFFIRNLSADLIPARVQISGGEPLLHPHFAEILTFFARETRCATGFTTNGTLFNDSILRLCQKLRPKIILSCPSLTPERYRMLTGSSISEFANGVHLLEQCGIAYNMNTVLTSSNEDDVLELVNYSATRGVSLKILPEHDMATRDYMAVSALLRLALERLAQRIEPTDRGVVKYHVGGANGAVIRLLTPMCSPCDAVTCRKYGELRLFPTFRLSSCIYGLPSIDISEPVRAQSVNELNRTFRPFWEHLQ